MSRFLALLPLVLLGACQLHPDAELTPDMAVAACSGPVTLALRSRDASLTAIRLAPPPATRVERRRIAVGRQPIGTVVEGAGAAARAGAPVPLRYLCLLDPTGGAVFVDAATAAGEDELLAACRTAPAGPAGCLADRLRGAERTLAAAEAAALTRVPAARRSAVEEPLATSIGAWRVYRDAECARRSGGSDERAAACRVGLTQARTAELAG